MRLSITGGTLVSSQGTSRMDVVCQDELIEAVGEPEAARGDVDIEIDARGLLVFPGFIDPHVHSRDPGLTHKEDFAHSTRAAAAGGVTTLLEMPNAVPPVTSAAIFDERAAYHARSAAVDFGLWGLALGSENLADIDGLFAAGAVGVKLFWGYALHRRDLTLVYNLADAPPQDLIQPPSNGEILALCRSVARCGGLLAAHCEDRSIIEAAEATLAHPATSYAELLEARPALAEAVSVAIAAELSAATGCRFHVVHTASAAGVAVVRRAQAAGVRLTAETCPHYLTLSQDDFSTLGTAMKIFPLVRDLENQAALWEGVDDGTIGTIGSDHAPHTRAEKARGLAAAPAGAHGVETIGPVMVDQMLGGRLPAERLAWLLSESAARLYGLYPSKGVIQPGAHADFTLVAPDGTTRIDNRRLHSSQPQSPWHGRELRGAIRYTILRGQIIARNGEPEGAPRGQLLRARHAASQPAPVRPSPPGHPMLAFTHELDSVVRPDIAPATRFELS